MGRRKASSTTSLPVVSWQPTEEDMTSLVWTMDVAFGRDPNEADPNGGRDDLPARSLAGHRSGHDPIVSLRISAPMLARLDAMARTFDVPRSDLLYTFVHSELGQYGPFVDQSAVQEYAA